MAATIYTMGGPDVGVWQSSDGRKTKYEDMNIVHLANAIKKMERECEAAQLKVQMVWDNELKPLEIPEIKLFMENCELLKKTTQQYMADNNIHYSAMVATLKVLAEKEKKEQEERERPKVLPDTKGGWF